MSEFIDRLAKAAFEAYAASHHAPDIHGTWEAQPAFAKDIARAQARAVLEAAREPAEGAVAAADDLKYGEPVNGYAVDVPAIWTAMIDAALSEAKETVG